jgi:periplasmic protein TonB
MKDNLKEIPGFDELVFENRNKEYGAYFLRKKYDRNVIISLITASFIGITAVVVPFLNVLDKQNQYGTEVKMRYVQLQMDKLKPPENELIIEPPPEPAPPSSQPSIKYVAPVVVDSILPFEKPLPVLTEVQTDKPGNDQVVAVNSSEQNEITGETGGEGTTDLFMLEVKPTFRGGDVEKFRIWVSTRTIYPQEAQDKGIQGKVYLTFIVERDGSVSNVKVVQGVDPILDNEAVKAIEASPKWSPGLQRGRPVRVRFAIYLNFTNN